MTRSGLVILTSFGSSGRSAGTLAFAFDFGGLPVFAATACAGIGSSFVIADAGLSVRRPWKTEWRMRPSGVHSPNETSATSSGFTQWPRASAGFSCSGVLSVASGFSCAWIALSEAVSKPVPTLPA
jgi:hypothetical protein